jgi:hypothetical protein
MGLDHSLGKDTRVFSVEEQIDTGQLDVLLGSIPVASELLELLLIGVDENWAPISAAIVIFAEALARNRAECAISLLAVGDPLFGQSAVVLRVIKGLKGEPVGGSLNWVAVINALKRYILVNFPLI